MRPSRPGLRKAGQWVRNRFYLLLDVLALPSAAYLAFVLRLDRLSLEVYWPTLALLAFLALILAPPIFRWAGLYSRYWPYASVGEALLIAYAVTIMVAGVTVAHLAATWSGVLDVPTLPRSIPLIFLLLTSVAVGAPRLGSRLLTTVPRIPERESFERTLIVGAGQAGMMTAQELQRNPHLGRQPIGFIDDDPAKLGTQILGIPVLGTRAHVPVIISDHRVTGVIIAMPTAPGKVIRDVVASCDSVNIVPQILPGMYQLLDSRVIVEHLRQVEIEDLLRREPVQTDLGAVGELIAGRRVLVTGAGGSIGSELCRQALRFGPSDLVLVGHSENSIFAIENELRALIARWNNGAREMPGVTTAVHPVIADIRFAPRMSAVFQRFRPDIVFHAGAHKHVPLMEHNPSEAASNNVIGTLRVLEAARQVGVQRFVFVSTDKAVQPTSVMGATKRVAELLVNEAAAETGYAYLAVRFGNVLGSSGSVVLTMKQQIAAGGPVTITHPDMSRFFMTIPEAVQLILQAAVLGRGGEILMFDMGEPVRIVDLANDLIRLSGLEADEDIDVEITGVRPGEKLHETLFMPGESYQRTEHDKIYVVGSRNLQSPVDLERHVALLGNAVEAGDDEAVRDLLRALLPDYRPGNSLNQLSVSTPHAGEDAGDLPRSVNPLPDAAGP